MVIALPITYGVKAMTWRGMLRRAFAAWLVWMLMKAEDLSRPAAQDERSNLLEGFHASYRFKPWPFANNRRPLWLWGLIPSLVEGESPPKIPGKTMENKLTLTVVFTGTPAGMEVGRIGIPYVRPGVGHIFWSCFVVTCLCRRIATGKQVAGTGSQLVPPGPP